MKLARDDDFYFAHHGRFVETTTIVTRLLSSDTIISTLLSFTITTIPAIAAGKIPHLHSYTHPKFKRKKIIYVAIIFLIFLKLAGDGDFHFAHHGRFVKTATIVTRLLSSDTSNPIEQQLLHITMPHPHPKSSIFNSTEQRVELVVCIRVFLQQLAHLHFHCNDP